MRRNLDFHTLPIEPHHPASVETDSYLFQRSLLVLNISGIVVKHTAMRWAVVVRQAADVAKRRQFHSMSVLQRRLLAEDRSAALLPGSCCLRSFSSLPDHTVVGMPGLYFSIMVCYSASIVVLACGSRVLCCVGSHTLLMIGVSCLLNLVHAKRQERAQT